MLLVFFLEKLAWSLKTLSFSFRFILKKYLFCIANNAESGKIGYSGITLYLFIFPVWITALLQSAMFGNWSPPAGRFGSSVASYPPGLELEILFYSILYLSDYSIY